MKKRIAAGICTILAFIMLSKSGVLGALMIFVLVGAIPGTTFSLPAGLMFAVCAIAALLITFRYTLISFIEAVGLHRLTRKHLAYRERMPKRRFRNITHPQA